MTEDPKQRAARTAAESLAVADDLLRHTRRRALVERLANAKARRESALRSTADRLREQGRVRCCAWYGLGGASARRSWPRENRAL